MIDHIARGVQINSALYLVACFVAGLVQHNPFAWRLAIAAMGVTYLSYLFQLSAPNVSILNRGTVYASIVLGICAGLSLLIPWQI